MAGRALSERGTTGRGRIYGGRAIDRLKQLLAWPFILLLLFFWWRAIRTLELGATLAQVRGNEGVLLLALLCAWLYLLGQALVWRTITAALATPLPWRQAMRAWMLSNLARYLPGSVWHFVGRVYLTQQAGVSRASGALGVLLEQLLQLLSALLLVALTLPFWPVGSPVRAQSWLLLLLPVGLIVVHPRFFFPLLNRVLALLRRAPLPATVRYRQMLAYLLSYLGVHLTNGLALGFAVLALRAPLAVLPAAVGGALFAWTLGYLSVLTPGGLGLREAVLTLVLAPVLGAEIAALGALLWRAANLLSEVLSALFFEVWSRWE